MPSVLVEQIDGIFKLCDGHIIANYLACISSTVFTHVWAIGFHSTFLKSATIAIGMYVKM